MNPASKDQSFRKGPTCADLPHWPQEPLRPLPVFPTSGEGAREEPCDDLATTTTTTFTRRSRKKVTIGGRRSRRRETAIYLHGMSVLHGTEGLQAHMLQGHGRAVLHLHYIFPYVFTKSSRQKSWEDISEIICIQVCLHKPWSIFYMTLTTCNTILLVAKEIFGFIRDTCLN